MDRIYGLLTKTNLMLMDEKVDQWNSTESLDTGPNPNKKLVHDKAVFYISRPKKKKGLFNKWH